MKSVRTMRLLVYEGPEDWVNKTLKDSYVHGKKVIDDGKHRKTIEEIIQKDEPAKAFIICCNDSMEHVVFGDEKRANQVMEELKETRYVTPGMDRERDIGRLFWHLHETKAEGSVVLVTLADQEAIVERMARTACALAGYKCDVLEPGNLYAGQPDEVEHIDGYCPNGDPGHWRWKDFLEHARIMLASIRTFGKEDCDG